MSLKLPLPFALFALVLNGIACACPSMPDSADMPSHAEHAVDVSHHHAAQAEHDCEDECDCVSASVTKAERNLAARIDTRIVADDGDIVATCPAPEAAALTALSARPPPALAAPANRIRKTPVSRYERMLD